MTAGRVLASLTAGAAVAGCIVAVTAMAHAGNGDAPTAADAQPITTAAATHNYAMPVVPTPTTGVLAATPTTASAPRTASTLPRSSASHAAAASTRPAAMPSTSTGPSTPPAAKAQAARSATTPVRGVALPLRYSTHNATRVVTVTGVSRGSTTARLQAWYKAPGGGWLKYGTGMTAHIGAQGMSPTPSESESATPMGSFTLTQAFGHNANPDTPLPYFRTGPSDWWISQPGPLYNTHQRCAGHCAFRQSMPPNEHLYYETPFYNYAVVIDYNTRNAPGGVRQGAGSAFFLHVTDGNPTAGCVAIPQNRLIMLMRWLRPATHPRILIGVR